MSSDSLRFCFVIYLRCMFDRMRSCTLILMHLIQQCPMIKRKIKIFQTENRCIQFSTFLTKCSSDSCESSIHLLRVFCVPCGAMPCCNVHIMLSANDELFASSMSTNIKIIGFNAIALSMALPYAFHGISKIHRICY